MLLLRPRFTGSWLDPDAQRYLSFKLTQRLLERCEGEKGVCITLTYRVRDYSSDVELYDRQSQEQHVPMFIRRLSAHLDQSLTGRWFCKMEFQKNGFVHWHMILLGVAHIPHADLSALWGHGHVWIRRMDKTGLRYAAKYVSKGGGLPPWLRGEPPKSVKIIRVSPGFWRKPKDAPQGEEKGYGWNETMYWDDGRPCRLTLRDHPDFDTVVGTADPYGWVKRHEPKNLNQKLAKVIRPTAEAALDRAKRKAVAQDTDTGKFIQLEGVNFGILLYALVQLGAKVSGMEKGWLMLDGDTAKLERAVEVARQIEAAQLARREREEEELDALVYGDGVPAEGGHGLHLIGTRNPDSRKPLHLRKGYPRWLREYWEWDALRSERWAEAQVLEEVADAEALAFPRGEILEVAA